MDIPEIRGGSGHKVGPQKRLYETAQKLEATFLAEMLKSAGLGKSRDSFGGGAGEEQFGSFLLQQQAMQIVKAGGIGLTETLFEALRDRTHDQTD
ncbi:rod-binding protein [Sulfitobacter sp. CW3]|jgi:Rod binding domain-containing protein|uniref:rod-binding protein n=1 Tax=Sulfitobacter sp. CW3 TaxID=2861965 RepID=UPI001C5FAE8E|nr:rod-binding protein [Sulfitobacter sp. CW3]MBW4962651.1 rod-binding protein [Sulfitobacter sp. CW3]|tara:strand:- start:190797 stop:191081 length:285 start_codon:yes stop_codon:yes gene_type:complete